MTTTAAAPIWISRRTQRVLVTIGLVALALVLWRAPALVTLSIGGGILALTLSFPVRWLSRVMPRPAAVTLSLVLAAALSAVALAFVVPIVVDQLSALVAAVPGITSQLDQRLPSLLDWLSTRGLLPAPPERFLSETRERLVVSVQASAGRMLGGLGRLVSGVVGVAFTLAGSLFMAVYMLLDARRARAAVLRGTPHRYRRDASMLWNAFADTLSRYLGGLTLLAVIEGALASIALRLVGVPFAFLLGAGIFVTAFIPYFGAWLGYGPAVVLALTISPARALTTTVVCWANNMFVANVLTPRIQGQVVRVHPIVVFFAIIGGGALFGVGGVILAVPAVAMLRVLFDFLRVRLRVADVRSACDVRAR